MSSHAIRIKSLQLPHSAYTQRPVAILFNNATEYAQWFNSGQPRDIRAGVSTILLRSDAVGQTYGVSCYISRAIRDTLVTSSLRNYAVKLYNTQQLHFHPDTGTTTPYVMWAIAEDYYEVIQ